MRKILAGFMATSMIVAVASSVTFAAAASATFTITDGNVVATTGNTKPTSGFKLSSDKWSTTVNYTDLTINLPSVGSGGATIVIPLNETFTYSSNVTCALDGIDDIHYSGITIPASDLIDLLDGQSFNLTVNNYRYSGDLKKDNGKIKMTFDQSNADINTAGATVTLNSSASTPTPVDIINKGSNAVTPDTYASVPAVNKVTVGASFSTGTGNAFTDVETSGTFTDSSIGVAQVLVTDGEGNPIPLTEKQSGADKDLNDEGGVQSGKTLYFMIRDDGPLAKLGDDHFWKLKITKGDNGKYVKAVSDVTKIFNSNLINSYTNKAEPGTGDGKRHRYIKVELNEIYTDDEYKISLDMRLSAKSAAVDAKIAADDSEIKVKDFYFWMKNIVKNADNDWRVGIGGLMLNPLENDWNDVTYFDEDGDVAHIKFFADSDVGKFYAKLSTKWEHADYASYFNDQDAFIFNFTGSPKISSTSRCDLEIYNPFLDEDGNETIDPSTAVVYQVIDGDLYDVTDSFSYKEGENGDMAFTTRTRFLGTYIICEKAVEEAVADETVPDELTPDTTEAPEDVTPDNNAGGKQPANTGKYL